MLPSERDAAYLWDMMEAAKNIVGFVAGKTFDNYKQEAVLRSAVERQIEILGEAANHVSGEFQRTHSNIPWHKIIGQRNVLAHEYKDIADKLVWAVAKEHIPALISQLEKLVPKLNI